MRLWRPEMLSGVLELTDKGVVVKADAVAGAWGTEDGESHVGGRSRPQTQGKWTLTCLRIPLPS